MIAAETLQAPVAPHRPAPLTDGYGRAVTYLRLSVTDRCDLRCTYCMPQHMVFLPRRDLLSLEELDQLASAFVGLGVRKLRLTGGEPLARKGILTLVDRLSRHLGSGALDELTLTTNGSQLASHARALRDSGVRRINVSLDTLDAGQYRDITRGGDIAAVLDGIDAALAAGLKVKLNTVALRGVIEGQADGLIRFAHARGMTLTLIETMPLGETGADRLGQFLSLATFRRELGERWSLTDLAERSGGPAAYVQVAETGGRLGFITPLSCNFCAGCNRVRVSSTGRLYTCMGQEGSVDLRAALRDATQAETLAVLIAEAIGRKPKGHAFEFAAGRVTGISRHMSTLGG